MKGSILHIFGWDKKFVLPFRDLVREQFLDGRHQFVIYGLVGAGELEPAPDTLVFRRLQKHVLALSSAMRQADKIIIHGLSSSHLRYILSLQPWLLKKCYWVIWGGDLYVHLAENKSWQWRKNEFFRRLVISRLGHLVTYIEGDVELARQWYGARGQYHECLIYPSNTYHDYPIGDEPHQGTHILIGNSAYPSNNHREILEHLWRFRDQDIHIYAPLSYGRKDYAAQISEEGRRMFGNRFHALTDFMPFDQYLKLLGQIDIAIFNHNRQQGMGNIITLLGLGKKVYLRDEVTPWSLFQRIGVKVHRLGELDLAPLDPAIQAGNRALIQEYFSRQRLIDQLRKIFEE